MGLSILGLLFNELEGIGLVLLLGESRGINFILLFNKLRGPNLVSLLSKLAESCTTLLLSESIEFCNNLANFLSLCLFLFWGTWKVVEMFVVISSSFSDFFCSMVEEDNCCLLIVWGSVWRCSINCPHSNVVFINFKCWKCAFIIGQHVGCWCFVTCDCKSTSCSLDIS